MDRRKRSISSRARGGPPAHHPTATRTRTSHAMTGAVSSQWIAAEPTMSTRKNYPGNLAGAAQSRLQVPPCGLGCGGPVAGISTHPASPSIGAHNSAMASEEEAEASPSLDG